jgi:hypothetical protein
MFFCSDSFLSDLEGNLEETEPHVFQYVVIKDHTYSCVSSSTHPSGMEGN